MAVEKKYELWIQNVKNTELKNELLEIQKMNPKNMNDSIKI